jgi:hypothetical protein
MMKIFFGASEPDEFTVDVTGTPEMKRIIGGHKVTIELFNLLVRNQAGSPRSEIKNLDPELQFESE